MLGAPASIFLTRIFGQRHPFSNLRNLCNLWIHHEIIAKPSRLLH
jgi:hypothetical protein